MGRLLSSLVEPVGAVWVVLILATAWRVYRKQYRRAAVPAVVAGLMFVFGSTTIPARLLAGLERPYAGVRLASLAPAEVVVMLGGALRVSANDPLGFQIADSGDRVITAVEAARASGARTVILGGGKPSLDGPMEADYIREWLTRWQLLPGVTLLEFGPCRNTRDEAERMATLAREKGWRRIILVTSAGHMRRSEALFRKLGLDVTCVAGDFRGLSRLEARHRFNPVPTLSNFDLLSIFCYETVGYWVYWWRGWV
jgi:uncharacterized SAM-binding protein YcdF (DUF218 family)